MKFKFFVLIITLCFFSQTSYSLCKRKSREVIIGWDEWPPYIYQEKKEIKGFDYEIIKKILEINGCKYVFSEAPWNRLLNQIKSGTIHLIMGVSWTKERSKFAYYSKPFRDESIALFIRKEDIYKFKFNNFEELFNTDIKIGYVTGEYLGPQLGNYLKSNNKKGKLKLISGNEILLNFKNLKTKRIDALVADKYTGLFLFKKSKDGAQIMQHPFIISTNKVHFIFTKSFDVSITQEDIKNFNHSLEEFRKSHFQDIVDKYFSSNNKN